jgi:hypothetical protein
MPRQLASASARYSQTSQPTTTASRGRVRCSRVPRLGRPGKKIQAQITALTETLTLLNSFSSRPEIRSAEDTAPGQEEVLDQAQVCLETRRAPDVGALRGAKPRCSSTLASLQK